jgi:hypothetical protein
MRCFVSIDNEQSEGRVASKMTGREADHIITSHTHKHARLHAPKNWRQAPSQTAGPQGKWKQQSTHPPKPGLIGDKFGLSKSGSSSFISLALLYYLERILFIRECLFRLHKKNSLQEEHKIAS